MKPFSFTVLAAIFSTITAQKIADYLPECSLDCLSEARGKVTDCPENDAVCWCVQSNYEAIYNSGVSCVLQECGADKSVDEVLPAAAEFCAAATASAAAEGSQAVSSTATTGGASQATISSTGTITMMPTTAEATGASETSEAAAPSLLNTGWPLIALGALAIL